MNQGTAIVRDFQGEFEPPTSTAGKYSNTAAMRRVLSARTRGSLARARSAGRVGGRRPKLTAEADAAIRARRDTGTAVPELAGACGGLRNPEC
jgi:hypothetical protein